MKYPCIVDFVYLDYFGINQWKARQIEMSKCMHSTCVYKVEPLKKGSACPKLNGDNPSIQLFCHLCICYIVIELGCPLLATTKEKYYTIFGRPHTSFVAREL